MTFPVAIQSLRDGEAIKRESWTSYIRKDVKPDDAPEAPKYDLVLVKRDGTEHVYSFSGGTDVPVMLSRELLEGFMRDDWIRGSAAAFEKARTAESDF